MALTMDSSNRVEYISGERNIRVAASEMTPEEWFLLINKKLKLLKPHLKYLPCFTPFGDFVKDDDPNFTPIWSCSFSENDLKVKCYKLLRVETIIGDEKIGLWGDIDYSNTPRHIRTKSLLLTNKGEFRLWDAEYALSVKGPSKGPRSEQCIAYSLSNKLQSLGEEEILRYLKVIPGFPKKFFNILCGELGLTQREMIKRAEEIKDLERDMLETIKRITWEDE